MSIARDPFAPAIVPPLPSVTLSTSIDVASKSKIPVPASSAFTGFAFQATAPANTTTVIPSNSSSSTNTAGFTFFPTPQGISKVVQEETTEADEEEGFPKEESEAATREANDKEDTLYEIRVKHYKYLKAQKEWKNFGTGVLRVMQSKVEDDPHNRPKRRMVLRNETVGTVLLNVAIGKGMEFLTETQPKHNTGCIRFINPADEEMIMFKVRGIDNLERFYSLLSNLAKA